MIRISRAITAFIQVFKKKYFNLWGEELMIKKLSAYKTYMIYSGATSFLFSLMFTMTSIFYIETVKVNPLQLVLIGTVLETACFLFEIPTGIVADMYSRKLSIIIGVGMIGVGFILESFIPAYGIVLLSQIIWGVGATFLSGAEEAWIADEVGDKELERLFMKSAQIGQVFSVLGIVVSGLLGSIGVRLPMIISGILFIGLSIFLVLFMPENGFKPTPMEDKNTWQKMGHTFLGGLKAIRKSTVLMSILGIALIYGLYSEGIDRLWGAHFLEDIILPSIGNLKPALWFGIISTSASILGIIAVEIIKRHMEKKGKMDRMWLLVIVNMLLIGSLFIFGLSGSFGIGFASYLAVSTFRRINEPIYRAWMNQGIESNVRATVLSTMGQIDAFGQIIGGVIIGFIAKQISISMGIVSAALILCPVILLYVFAINKNRNRLHLKELE